jgi:hypothetical protein
MSRAPRALAASAAASAIQRAFFETGQNEGAHLPTTAKILAPSPLNTPEQDQSCAPPLAKRTAQEKLRIRAHYERELAALAGRA